jgi:hypothetical protein
MLYLTTCEDGTDSVPKRWLLNYRRRGITQKKADNMTCVTYNKNEYILYNDQPLPSYLTLRELYSLPFFLILYG